MYEIWTLLSDDLSLVIFRQSTYVSPSWVRVDFDHCNSNKEQILSSIALGAANKLTLA